MNIAILGSGGFTTAEAVINACSHGKLQGLVFPRLVVASNYKHSEQGRQRVEKAGISPDNIKVIRPKDYENLDQFGQAILVECRRRQIDFICQYGWMARTPQNVIDAFFNRMVNQHPGPLHPGYPDFGGYYMYGMIVHTSRLFFARKVGHDLWTEATAHRVHPELDRGAVILTQRMEILPEDTPESVQKRLLPIEWQLQIDTLELFAKGQEKELVRKTRLVLLEEEQILAQAKEVARLLYPHG